MISRWFYLPIAGTIAGLIDSMAGGGGLITLPTLALAVGAGPMAIGTNKIAGVFGALIALLVYSRGGRMDWHKGIAFGLCVALGSWLGSRVSPFIPVEYFKYFLAVTCPLILWIVWNKELWIIHGDRPTGHASWLWLSGLACGFYDGIWGPGGGTFMLLSLLFIARLPLFTALTVSKLANTLSAGMALISYSQQGFVRAQPGLAIAGGVAFGAFCGAKMASQSNTRLVRPALALVAMVLALKIWV